jgi:hypothetical protein
MTEPTKETLIRRIRQFTYSEAAHLIQFYVSQSQAAEMIEAFAAQRVAEAVECVLERFADGLETIVSASDYASRQRAVSDLMKCLKEPRR